MEADLTVLMENLAYQYFSTISEKTPGVVMFPSDAANNECCYINIFAYSIPLLPHDYYMGVSFQDWRKHVEPVTNACILTCKTKKQAMEILNLERENLLEQLWWQREYVQRLQRAIVMEERNRRMKEAQLEQEFECNGMELAKCIKALQDVQKQFGEYKAQHQHQHQHEPIEQPESIAEILKDKFHTKEN